jgi:hypothetical protein
MRVSFISYQLGIMRNLLTAGITAVSLLPMIAPNAMAIDTYSDAKGFVYTDVSQYPNASLTGYVDGVPKAFSIKTDACGMAEIKTITPPPSSPEYRVGDTGYYLSKLDLPTAAAVTCNKTTGALSSPRTGSFRPSPAITGTDFVYIGAPNATVKMWRTTKLATKSTKNACGIAKTKIKLDPIGLAGRGDADMSYDLPGVSGDSFINATQLNPNPPVCRKNATGGGSLYVPAPN